MKLALDDINANPSISAPLDCRVRCARADTAVTTLSASDLLPNTLVHAIMDHSLIDSTGYVQVSAHHRS
jgi:hypothetical protein